MVFVAEKNAFIIMAHYRRGSQNPDVSWEYNLESWIQQFKQRFPNRDFNHHCYVNRRKNII